jgi:hypothetical protein
MITSIFGSTRLEWRYGGSIAKTASELAEIAAAESFKRWAPTEATKKHGE